jgi:ABC-type glycerol-3-phosphate transport system permease component
VLVTLTVGTAGAYSLNRFRFYARDKIATLVLFTYMFAPIMIVIPFYVLVRKLGIANTHFALVLAYTALCLPFSLWLLKTFFQAIPMELEEAAYIDGAGRWQAVRYVMLPLALPGIIATGIFTFILAWNDYIFVRILITSDTLKTLSVGIADLYNATVIDWGMIMAGSMLITAPVLVVFIFIQRFLIAGWGAGGVKG